ncbi:MAG: choice-of-anchor E domain-containing protein [Isosphaeraceae bacterium]
MSAFGWITAARRRPLASWLWRSRVRKATARKAQPGLESLESIDLMSRAGLTLPAAAVALSAPVTPSSVKISGSVTATATQTVTVRQDAAVPSTLTNFNQPFNPSINLFNPNLGQLVAVNVVSSAQIQSLIISENTSTTSGADITGTTNGTYTINGFPTAISGTLNGTTQTVSVPAFTGGPPDFTGPTTVFFPPLIVTDTKTTTFNSPAALAYFTSSAGRTSITPRLIENAQSGASAPNGNLQTIVQTLGSGTISVNYVYMPRCPAVVSLVRFGIHQQPTLLQLTFDGPLDPAQASNPNYYRIAVPNKNGSFTGPGVTYVPIASAKYDAATNTVLLTTARRLNVHYMFQLQIFLPCNNGNVITIQFGGKRSLGGFVNPHKGNAFVPVRNGKVIL